MPIAESFLIPTGYERMLPPGVQLTVRSRRRVLSQRARGRVLDLGGAESHQSLWSRPDVADAVIIDGPVDARLDELARRGDRFDTVFSIFRLVAATDLPALLGRIRDVLDDEGQLLFLEPGRRTGSSSRARRAATPGITLATGWRVDRDVPAELRRARLSVTDLDRHRTSTVQWWLRTLVEGSAHHALELARPSS